MERIIDIITSDYIFRTQDNWCIAASDRVELNEALYGIFQFLLVHWICAIEQNVQFSRVRQVEVPYLWSLRTCASEAGLMSEWTGYSQKNSVLQLNSVWYQSYLPSPSEAVSGYRRASELGTDALCRACAAVAACNHFFLYNTLMSHPIMDGKGVIPAAATTVAVKSTFRLSHHSLCLQTFGTCEDL